MGSFVDVGKELFKFFSRTGIVEVLPEQVFDPFFHEKGLSPIMLDEAAAKGSYLAVKYFLKKEKKKPCAFEQEQTNGLQCSGQLVLNRVF